MYTKSVTSFTRQYHAILCNIKTIVFWPDQARAHYAKSVFNYLNKNNVNFVRRNDNPVNVPECRPL